MCFQQSASFVLNVPKEEALIGFRNWLVKPDEKGEGGELYPLFYGEDPWKGEAKCSATERALGESHPAPERYHTCGVHAFAQADRARTYSETSLVGAVRAWGKIVGHGTDGFRAEFMEPIVFADKVPAINALRADVRWYEGELERATSQNRSEKVQESLRAELARLNRLIEIQEQGPKEAGERHGAPVVAMADLEAEAKKRGTLYRDLATRKMIPGNIDRELARAHNSATSLGFHLGQAEHEARAMPEAERPDFAPVKAKLAELQKLIAEHRAELQKLSNGE